jgi:hypothetical protein
MRIRIGLFTALMIGGWVAGENRHVCARGLERSAQAFSKYFHELGQESLNPVQRLALSLVLVNAKPDQRCQASRRGV